MRNGASDKLTRSRGLPAEEIFALYRRQIDEEYEPGDPDNDEITMRSYHLTLKRYETAKKVFERAGLEGLLNHEDEAIVDFGIAIESGDASKLAI